MGLVKIKLSILVLALLVFASKTLAAREFGELRQCKRQCRHQRQFEGNEGLIKQQLCENLCEKSSESGEPFVFQDEDFTPLFETQHGSLRVLEKFSQSSQLFRGIENYRLLILEANPLSFVTPNHWDSDVLFFVCQGFGTITLVYEDRLESFNLEKGHLMVIPAGVTFYMINRDDHEKLVLSMLVIPVANFGTFQLFFGVGGLKPESYLNAFSTNVLESSFNTSIEELRIFGQQREGMIISASKEQIKALTADQSNEIDYCLKDLGPCQLLSRQHGYFDELGTLFSVTPSAFQKLNDLNMFVSLSNISQGCMNVPFYSTRIHKFVRVVSGFGRLEMATPQVEGKRISVALKPGMVFLVPPGNPLVLMASKDSHLETVCMEVHAKGNAKFQLAGTTSIMKNLPKEAKELAFAASAEVVDKVLNSLNRDFFLKGPLQPSTTSF